MTQEFRRNLHCPGADPDPLSAEGRGLVRHRTDGSMAQAEYLDAATPFGRRAQPGHRMQHPFRIVRGLSSTAPP